MKKVFLVRLKPEVYARNSHPVGFRPPYILKYIEALLKREDICFVDIEDYRVSNFSYKDALRRIDKQPPHVIVISISALNANTSLEFCRKVKENKKNIFIIGVGQDVTARIEEYKKMRELFDVALAGEAEAEVSSIIKDIAAGACPQSLKNTYKDSSEVITVPNLDSLPPLVYSRDLLKKYYLAYPLKIAKRLVWGHILSSRGCPHGCVFCSQVMRESYGTVTRLRPAKSVVDEMEQLIKTGANIISFDDDNFTADSGHVEMICREIKIRKFKVKWIVHARVDEVSAPLLKEMKAAGCVLIRFGVESGSEKVLKALGKTKDTKLWLKKAGESVKEAKSLGMAVACLFIVGSPFETKEEVCQSMRLARELSPDIIQVAYFTVYSGSKIYKALHKQHENNFLPASYHYGIPSVNLSSMSSKDLREVQARFYRNFLIRPVFLAKHFFYHLPFYVTNPRILRNFIRGGAKVLGFYRNKGKQ